MSPSDTFVENRVQLHYAIQFIAAASAALLPPEADGGHVTVQWDAPLYGFVGAVIPAPQPFQVALDPLNLVLLMLDADQRTIAEFPLHHHTQEEGLAWLRQEITQRGANAESVVFLTYPPDDFPDHAIATGATFDERDPEERQALVHYYSETNSLLQAIATTTEGASPVRIWPHHFDMATLITLPETRNGESLFIGVGLSPGDKSYAEPYWYVSPYPYPPQDNLPSLEGNGFWHTDHWVGAVLKASQLTARDGQDREQATQIKHFLDSAVNASRQLLLA